MTLKYKPSFKIFFSDFGYKVIRLKYFIMVVVALVLEIITLAVYLLNHENVIGLELFTASILYGATSTIIVVLAVGCLVLLKLDKTRDKKKIKQLLDFKRNYQSVKNKYIKDIIRFAEAFKTENVDLEIKINYATVLENLYDAFIKGLSRLEIPRFLNKAFDHESRHLAKEKQFYNSFSMLAETKELKGYNIESDLAHSNYLKEIDKLEKSLKLLI